MGRTLFVLLVVMRTVAYCGELSAQSFAGTYIFEETPFSFSPVKSRCTYGSLRTRSKEDVLLLMRDSTFTMCSRIIENDHLAHTSEPHYSGAFFRGRLRFSDSDTLLLESADHRSVVKLWRRDSVSLQIVDTSNSRWNRQILRRERTL